MRISDWSSDVCSSDLQPQGAVAAADAEPFSYAMAQSAIRSAGGSVSLVPLPHWVVWSVKAIGGNAAQRSEEHTSELQSLMRISYAVFCLKKKKKTTNNETQIMHKIMTQ